MRRRAPIEINVNHERWLISYSDFITLLFGFFLVMYSVSQVNESKYRVLSEALHSTFASMPETDENSLDTIKKNNANSRTDNATLAEAIEKIRMQLSSNFMDDVDVGKIAVVDNEKWFEVKLDSAILFSPGSAKPSREAILIFDKIADALLPYQNMISVSGHTDNIPISTPEFSNNWELSAARAVSVVNLLAFSGVRPEFLSAIGYGEYRPIADNGTAEGRARNRRVIMRIDKKSATIPDVHVKAQNLETDIATKNLDRNRLEKSLIPENRQKNADSDSETGLKKTIIDEASLEKRTRVLDETGKITPIRLKKGGLLFTSDPESDYE